jgi:cytochrome c556
MKLNAFRMCGGPVLLAWTWTILMVMLASPSAQRGRRSGADANQGVPVATNTIAQNPDAYYGKRVTISAGVEQVLSKTVFLIDQRKAVGTTEMKAIGKPILVIAPYLTGRLDQKQYLLISGQIVKFDPEALARMAADYNLDLEAEVGAKYRGQPVLLATSVINSTYAELAKKPLPPLSAAEVALDAAMKTIGPAFAALRTAAEESKADVVTGNAGKLGPAFTQAETIWDDLGQSPAAEWAREARARAASIEGAGAAGNWDAVKSSAGVLNQLCQNCHSVYRVRLEDGTFRINPGSF